MTSMKTRRLVWFRSDLRVSDNTALHAACDAGGDVIGVFAITPGQWKDHDWGDRKVAFVLRNVHALRESLGGKNIPLKILDLDTFADVPGALAAMADELDVSEVYFIEEYELNERKRDENVEDRLESGGVSVHRFHDQVVLEPGSVRTNEGKTYTVYSPFSRKWAQVLGGRGGWEPRGTPAKRDAIDVKGDEVPTEVAGFDLSQLDDDLWPIGERAAMGRLQAFCRHRIDDYHEARDIPSIDGTSSLSAYLAAGVLGPRQCLHAGVEATGGTLSVKGDGAAGWINELVWREFYKHITAAFPRVCKHENFKQQYNAVEWRDDDDGFEAWCAGRTGYPIVDAAMRQLNQTGWMHNRLRMIAAMFLTKHLLIDWRRGERYFMQQLVDGDFASNNGGWQWSASTGTDAQPYFRVFNPWTQSAKFDGDGTFIKRHVEELRQLSAGDLHDPAKLGKSDAEDHGYPAPIVDHKPARERAIEAFKGL